MAAELALRQQALRQEALPPVIAPGGRLLILGSMPGAASLAAGRYYAHPRNLFWRIMGELAGAGPELPYDARLAALRTAGISLWDVLRSCIRPGSLDAAIRAPLPNDFTTFLAANPAITDIAFNGSRAAADFRRLVLPHLPVTPALHRLPSTSPAHAAMPYAQKLAAWRAIMPG